MRVWRISNYKDLSGIGGTYSEARWNKLGTRIVYCSDHPSTCMLELLVRFDPELTPNTYKLLEIELSKNTSITQVNLPEGWQDNHDITQNIWENNKAAVLKVPSVIMPQAYHFLLNPYHDEHNQHKIVGAYENILDERFYS